MNVYKLLSMLALLVLSINFAPAAFAEETSETKVVRGFLAAWDSNNIDKIMGFISEDCYYKNVPSLSGPNPVITGRKAMTDFLAPFFKKDPLIVPSKFHTEIKHVIAGGDGVALERVDNFEFGSTKIAVPVAAMFHVKNGKINYWVDYFDGATFGPVSTIMAAFGRK